MTLILNGVESPPVTSSGQILVAIIIALLTGSGGATLLALMRQRKLGEADKDKIISEAAGEAVMAAKEMISEYRKEVSELRERLAVADARIARLERDLMSADTDRARLKNELEEAIERRGAVMLELSQMQKRLTSLEARYDVEDQRHHVDPAPE